MDSAGESTKTYSFVLVLSVLIFISYIHGQLDVIPIGLLFISLNYLFKNKIFESAIFWAWQFQQKQFL